jgi:hypothetical protein
MNERIKQLATEAENYAHEQNELYGVSYILTYEQKFAELIVKECCDIVGDYYGQSKKSGPGYTMICEIKERFGVEE